MDAANSPPVAHLLFPHHIGVLLCIYLYVRGTDLGPIHKKMKQRMLSVLAREIGEMEPPTPFRELIGRMEISTKDKGIIKTFEYLQWRLTDLYVKPSYQDERSSPSHFARSFRTIPSSLSKLSFAGQLRLQNDFVAWINGSNESGYHLSTRDRRNGLQMYPVIIDLMELSKPEYYYESETALKAGHSNVASDTLRRFYDQRFAMSDDSWALGANPELFIVEHYINTLYLAWHECITLRAKYTRPAWQFLEEGIKVSREKNDPFTLDSCQSLMQRLQPDPASLFLALDRRATIKAGSSPLDTLWEVKKLLDLGEGLHLCWTKVYESVGVWDARLRSNLGIAKWPLHAVMAILWRLAGVETLAGMHERIVMTFVPVGDDDARVNVICGQAKMLTRQGQSNEALKLLLDPQTWRGLNFRQYRVWSRAVWSTFDFTAKRKEQHQLRQSFLKANQPPEPSVMQSLGGSTNPLMKRTAIVERLREAREIKASGVSVPAIKPLMEAIWSAEIRGMIGYYRTAVVLLADICIDLDLSHTCVGWLEEILPGVLLGNDLELRAYASVTYARCLIASCETGMNESKLKETRPHLIRAVKDYRAISLYPQALDALCILSIVCDNLGSHAERDNWAEQFVVLDQERQNVVSATADDDMIASLQIVKDAGFIIGHTLPGTPMDISSGTNGAHLNGSSSHSPAPNGDAEDASTQKFIPNMIYPPPDMRTIIDSTAGFVAASANPIQFEDKIRENHRQDPKFSFLNSADPYHAYYRHRIERVRNGEVAMNEKETQAAAPSTEVAPQASEGIPKEPPALEFVVDVPHKSALDLDIIKLTALFTARRGPSFLRALSTREGRNYQFDFLRPDHSLFSYFNTLVEQYRKVLYPPAEQLERLESLKTADGRAQLLADARARGQWDAYQKERESHREKEKEEEAKAFAEIDWHDFVIVQTIEFTQLDAQSELPYPMTVLDVEKMTLREKREAAAINEDTAPEVEAHRASQAAADAAAAAADHSLNEAIAAVQGGEMDVDDDEAAAKAEDARKAEEALARARELQARSTELGGQVKIRKDYVPKGLASRQTKVETTTCSICGQQIPVNELEEHMRIELLDPRWKSQRDVLEARRAQAHELQRGANAANALKQLARARGDLFDGDDEKRQREAEEEALRRKEREKGVWDGHTATKASTQDKYSTNVNFDEQIAAIHRAKGLGATDTSTIGPAIGPSMVPNLPVPPIPAPVPIPAFEQQLPNPAYAGAVISSGPQPASAPPMYGGPTGMFTPAPAPMPGAAAPPGIHPSRLAAMGGAPGSGGASPVSGVVRTADEAQMDAEPSMGTKRPRIERPEGHFYPEEDWLSMHPEPVKLAIQLPVHADKPEWKLDGSIIALPELPLTLLVSSLRDRIISHLSSDGSASVPASRIKLSFRGKLLTNANTLASYNLDDDDLMVMTLREGKKK
ncbi:hypothetical protein DL93DRAFT_2093642 [Clavulina sp. PMI_390]|nr:hypothetical protein DL93DRAFT_2093642 [Clavulina sp. PMI_390]